MLIDLDAFFASIEERERPELKGKPIVIGADPKQGKGRGVVSTANYEARKYGIHSGMPIAIAYKKCPQAIYLQPRIEFYEQVSDKIMNILKNYADAFEQVSIDEAYLDVSRRCQSFDDAKELALKIKNEIKEKEKLTCSIGIGPNKLIAKIAADFQKPDGLTIVKQEEVVTFLKPLSVRVIPGIGPKTEQALNRLGIKTIEQLQQFSKEELIRYFGSFGEYMYNAAYGIDESPVKESEEIKSISIQHTFEHDTKSKKLIYSKLRELINLLHIRLREERLSFKTITVKIRFYDFETHTSQTTLIQQSTSQALAFNIASKLIQPWLEKKKAIRLIGVSFSKLKPIKNYGQNYNQKDLTKYKTLTNKAPLLK